MNMEERKAKGMLWTDTPEAMEAQKKARGLAFDFNHLHPSKADERADLIREIIRFIISCVPMGRCIRSR